MCKTEEKIKKIIFYKFIYLGVLENEKKKKNIHVYKFLVFSSRRNEKKCVEK